MSVTKKQFEKILDENSDLKTYFNSKSDSRNWMIDALLEFNDEMKNHGNNRVVKNTLKTSQYPAALSGMGAVAGLFIGTLGSAATTQTLMPVFICVAIGAGMGLTLGSMAEKHKPEVNDWKPAQTATINVFRERARNYTP